MILLQHFDASRRFFCYCGSGSGYCISLRDSIPPRSPWLQNRSPPVLGKGQKFTVARIVWKGASAHPKNPIVPILTCERCERCGRCEQRGGRRRPRRQFEPRKLTRRFPRRAAIATI